jgi:hypothetical protein
MKNVKKIGWIPAILLSSSFAITVAYAVAQLSGGHVPGHGHKLDSASARTDSPPTTGYARMRAR